MTTRYVGPGGSDANNGLSWASRKLTLNGVEDTPVVAGDIVYVAPGTYRETLTVDVSGSSGSPITYIGDYDGSHTDGVGGVVRITGSDDDQSATRANCITATSKDYRTFKSFRFDICSSHAINLNSTTFLIIDKCWFAPAINGCAVTIIGSGQASNIIQDCFVWSSETTAAILFSHTSAIDNTNQLVQNCILIGCVGGTGVLCARVGGITIKNSIILACGNGVQVQTALNSGQLMTVNNCIISQSANAALRATTSAEFSENYNNLFNNLSDRNNVSTGTNSKSYAPGLDSRWFFQLVNAGAGPNSPSQVVTPFDLASYSQLINVAGTSPTSTDMRGTAVQGSQREWGALEYDSTLKIKGGGGISRARAQ